MMTSFSERLRLGRTLVAVKQRVALAVTEEFFRKHPDWDVKFGDRGRQHCTADVCFHLEFLAGAIEAGSPEAFGHYARWTARMLGARGITAHSLEENLAQLEEHLSLALSLEEHQAVSVFLARGRQACKELAPASSSDWPCDTLSLTGQVFLAAILAGQRQAAINIVDEALRSGHTHVDIYADVFAESMYRVGQLWELNKISVAQEHMAASITQYAISSIYPRLVPSPVRRGSMIITGVSGEQHQIGANLIADSMEANGWTVRFLGTNLPHSSVISAIQESPVDVLGVSTTIVSNLPAVVELLEAVRGNLQERAPKIVLGGLAYRLTPRFAHEVGAAGVLTDLRQAVAILCT